MFAEALAYALTLAPAWARRAGLLHQSIALAAYYRCCRKAWDEHYVPVSSVGGTGAFRGGEGRNGGDGLGSGDGHDLPLATLLARIQRMLLVDAIPSLGSALARLLDASLRWTVIARHVVGRGPVG